MTVDGIPVLSENYAARHEALPPTADSPWEILRSHLNCGLSSCTFQDNKNICTRMHYHYTPMSISGTVTHIHSTKCSTPVAGEDIMYISQWTKQASTRMAGKLMPLKIIMSGMFRCCKGPTLRTISAARQPLKTHRPVYSLCAEQLGSLPSKIGSAVPWFRSLRICYSLLTRPAREGVYACYMHDHSRSFSAPLSSWESQRPGFVPHLDIQFIRNITATALLRRVGDGVASHVARIAAIEHHTCTSTWPLQRLALVCCAANIGPIAAVSSEDKGARRATVQLKRHNLPNTEIKR